MSTTEIHRVSADNPPSYSSWIFHPAAGAWDRAFPTMTPTEMIANGYTHWAESETRPTVTPPDASAEQEPTQCPHCNASLLWSEDRGAHCDGCDDFDPEKDLPTAPSDAAREAAAQSHPKKFKSYADVRYCGGTDCAGQRENEELRKDSQRLAEALRAYESAFDGMFAHCLSNGVFNAWGKPMDCKKLNAANGLARDALAAMQEKGTT